MSLTFVYILIAFVVGCIIAWLWARANSNKALQAATTAAGQQYTELEKEYIGYKAKAEAELDAATKKANGLQDELNTARAATKAVEDELGKIKEAQASLQANYDSAVRNEQKAIQELTAATNTIAEQNETLLKLKGELAGALANEQARAESLAEKIKEWNQVKADLETVQQERDKNNNLLATANAENKALTDKLSTQKAEIEKLNQKFTTEFENVANKILDANAQKFTEQNKENLKGILEPLGRNIEDFRKQVDEVYKAESKERFSLGEKVKELADLNKVITDEARNLTKALKGEAKTQGGWGEMILETILEKSGLRKGDEYFMEYQLFDAEGKALRSEVEGKKMRPDALVMYPDNRHIIIDSKVSLNAYVRAVEAETDEQRKQELDEHLSSIKNHINSLSRKAYDDYDKTLDFVMMFVPNEAAYIAAMQADPELWSYAYERRILLISPTNLIAALKLMVDLWKREYQNRNAVAIAERGAKMYDKLVGFVSNLEDVGTHLGKAQGKFNEAFKQLSTGKDNLVSQATKMKALRFKTKGELPEALVEQGLQNDEEKDDI